MIKTFSCRNPSCAGILLRKYLKCERVCLNRNSKDFYFFYIIDCYFSVILMVLFSEAVAQKCSVKMVFLENSQNSQENTCARVSFLIKLQASELQAIVSLMDFTLDNFGFLTEIQINYWTDIFKWLFTNLSLPYFLHHLMGVERDH